MVRCLAAFLDFCYLVRREIIDEETMDKVDASLARFHEEREIFREAGIRIDFNLPRQHSLVHYQQTYNFLVLLTDYALQSLSQNTSKW